MHDCDLAVLVSSGSGIVINLIQCGFLNIGVRSASICVELRASFRFFSVYKRLKERIFSKKYAFRFTVTFQKSHGVQSSQ